MSEPHHSLFHRGRDLVAAWMERNDVRPLAIEVQLDRPHFDVCAYYRDDVITIWPQACAAPGMAGRAWSYPGYVVDRTPYGVLAHECAHHVDVAHGARGGIYGTAWRAATKEAPLTGYCPNDNEWFAEMFRLYLTNPDLLRLVRPRTHDLMSSTWTAVETRPWDEIVTPARQQAAARNKFAKPRK